MCWFADWMSCNICSACLYILSLRYVLWSHAKRVTVTTAWRVLSLRMAERPLIWRVKMVKWFRYRSGVTQRVGRGIALLFHDRDTRRGWVVSSTPGPHFTPGKDSVPILQDAGWLIWRVPLNILIKQSRRAEKGWCSILGVGRGADFSRIVKTALVTKRIHVPFGPKLILWYNLVQDTDRWRAGVNAAMNPRFP